MALTSELTSSMLVDYIQYEIVEDDIYGHYDALLSRNGYVVGFALMLGPDAPILSSSLVQSTKGAHYDKKRQTFMFACDDQEDLRILSLQGVGILTYKGADGATMLGLPFVDAYLQADFAKLRLPAAPTCLISQGTTAL